MTEAKMSVDQFRKLEEEYKTLQKKYKEARKECGEQAFKQSVKEWFEKYPQFSVVCWTQYAPYFNDG